MLNPKNIFCELIGVEFCFLNINAYHIILLELKKNDNTPRFIYEKEISLIVRLSRKNHDWVLLLS